jgi:hypothetical protein
MRVAAIGWHDSVTGNVVSLSLPRTGVPAGRMSSCLICHAQYLPDNCLIHVHSRANE